MRSTHRIVGRRREAAQSRRSTRRRSSGWCRRPEPEGVAQARLRHLRRTADDHIDVDSRMPEHGNQRVDTESTPSCKRAATTRPAARRSPPAVRHLPRRVGHCYQPELRVARTWSARARVARASGGRPSAGPAPSSAQVQRLDRRRDRPRPPRSGGPRQCSRSRLTTVDSGGGIRVGFGEGGGQSREAWR